MSQGLLAFGRNDAIGTPKQGRQALSRKPKQNESSGGAKLCQCVVSTPLSAQIRKRDLQSVVVWSTR